MEREFGSYDDIVLAALLGSWLGAQSSLWRAPLQGALVTITVVVLLYCLRTLILDEPRMRWVFALPTALVGVLVWRETAGPLLGPLGAWQLVAIGGVWVASMGIRALGQRLRRLK